MAKINLIPRDELCKIVSDFYGDALAVATTELHKRMTSFGRLKSRIGDNRLTAYARDIYDDLQQCINKRWIEYVQKNIYK